MHLWAVYLQFDYVPGCCCMYQELWESVLQQNFWLCDSCRSRLSAVKFDVLFRSRHYGWGRTVNAWHVIRHWIEMSLLQALRFKKAHVTHPDLKATFCLPIIGVKKNPTSPLYTSLGVITKGTVVEVRDCILQLFCNLIHMWCCPYELHSNWFQLIWTKTACQCLLNSHRVCKC